MAVSHTTRPKRENEENGKHYHFITKEQFLNDILKNQLHEWFEVDGYYFGMHKDTLKTIYAKNKIPIIIMGAKAVEESRRLCLKSYEICIIPANIDDYKKKIST